MFDAGPVEEVYDEDFDCSTQKGSPPGPAHGPTHPPGSSSSSERRNVELHSSSHEIEEDIAEAEAVNVSAFKAAEFRNIYRALYKDCDSLSKEIKVTQLTNLLRLLNYGDGEISKLLYANNLAPSQQSKSQSPEAVATQRNIRKKPISPNRPPSVTVEKVVEQRHNDPADIVVSRARVVHSPVQSQARNNSINANMTAVDAMQQRTKEKEKRKGKGEYQESQGSQYTEAQQRQQQQQQQAEELQRQFLSQKQQLAEEKEKRRLEGIAKAALELEQQAAIRKARQDAAREKLHQANARQAASTSSSLSTAETDHSSSSSVASASESTSRRASSNARPRNPSESSAAERDKLKQLREQVVQLEKQKLDPLSSFAQDDPKVAFHEKEINRLIGELEADSQLSAAAIHGIRKNIAINKAALLKEKQRVDQSKALRSNSAENVYYQQLQQPPYESGSEFYNGSRGSSGGTYQRAPTPQKNSNGYDGEQFHKQGQDIYMDYNSHRQQGGIASDRSVNGNSFLERERERERLRRVGAAAAPFCNDFSWQPSDN